MAYLGKDVIGILSHNKVMDTMTGDGSDTTLTLSRTPSRIYFRVKNMKKAITREPKIGAPTSAKNSIQFIILPLFM